MKAEKTKVSKKNESTEVKPAITQASERTYQEVLLSQIKINPLNPRKNFSGQKYDELLASVRRKGVLVPVLLRPLLSFPIINSGSPNNPEFRVKAYEIIAGERRYRVSCDIAKANGGLENGKIPALIQEMSDDDAFDIMTIENLHRADITPLEEARAFKLYTDKRGVEALPDLADRLGIEPRFIRRRIAVLDLPEKILESWETGKVSYGHLEQLSRVKDQPDELNSLFLNVTNNGMSVKYLKETIESQAPKLSFALFPKVDCLACPRNSTIQRNLFGEDMAAKALCLSPDCFVLKQGEWIRENWEKFKLSRNLKTNGVQFREELPYDARKHIYQATKKKCKTCEKYQSLISLKGSVDSYDICTGEKQCFDELYNPKIKTAKKESDPDAPRVAWHGEYFREEHFKTRLPELVKALSPDDEKILRILLLAVLETHSDACDLFGQKYDPEHTNKHWDETPAYFFEAKHTWPVIERLDSATIKSILQELALQILMDTPETCPDMRRSVAVHLGADLSTEWRMNQEYLDKKTTKEIHAIAEKFGIFKDEKARNFLFETLGGKRDRFDLLKKGELVQVILESGVDLAGKVPDEILNP